MKIQKMCFIDDGQIIESPLAQPLGPKGWLEHIPWVEYLSFPNALSLIVNVQPEKFILCQLAMTSNLQ
jgi:hypothetical protein